MENVMSRGMSKVLLAAAVIGLSSGAALAQQSTTSQTKTFEVIAVQGNQLVVTLPEGTREMTVADDFRFTVNGQQLAVRDLRPGMKGTATITTRTTVTPVTVTEVKNGTVAHSAGSSSPTARPAKRRKDWCAANCATRDRRSRLPPGSARGIAARSSSHGSEECRSEAVVAASQPNARKDATTPGRARRPEPRMFMG